MDAIPSQRVKRQFPALSQIVHRVRRKRDSPGPLLVLANPSACLQTSSANRRRDELKCRQHEGSSYEPLWNAAMMTAKRRERKCRRSTTGFRKRLGRIAVIL